MVKVGVVSTGMVNASGIGTDQVMAAVQAGLCLYEESNLINRQGVPYKMALVPDECLPDLPADLPLASPKGRYRRLLALAMAGLQTLPELPGADTPLYLALPERLGNLPFVALEPILKDLHQLLPEFCLERSKVFPGGRAGGAAAVRAATETMAAGEPFVLVGGVDSYLDLALMNRLRMDRRLLTPATNQGFVPGEGAGFVLLGAEPMAEQPVLAASATAEEEAHLYSEATCRGEGLYLAFKEVFKAVDVPVRTVFCGLNGENVAVKEWGLAVSRSALARSDFELHHPAENYGDLGAATFPTLLGLSRQRLLEKSESGPHLIWASSDYALRGAAILAL